MMSFIKNSPTPQVLRSICWMEFGFMVDSIIRKLKKHPRLLGIEFVTGPPRGGLVLAACLSHKLQLKYIPYDTVGAQKPEKGVLWIDDIVDFGNTLENFVEQRGKVGLRDVHVSLFKRANLEEDSLFPYLIYKELAQQGEWLVFPWEDRNQALSDFKSYHMKR